MAIVPGTGRSWEIVPENDGITFELAMKSGIVGEFTPRISASNTKQDLDCVSVCHC